MLNIVVGDKPEVYGKIFFFNVRFRPGLGLVFLYLLDVVISQ